jgi:hypothetical protein
MILLLTAFPMRFPDLIVPVLTFLATFVIPLVVLLIHFALARVCPLPNEWGDSSPNSSPLSESALDDGDRLQ